VKVYQIYYSEETKARLEPEYIPYYNNPSTVFFEAKVMCDLIDKGAHKGADYFGVVSPSLRNKIKGTKKWGTSIRNMSEREFSPKTFEQLVMDFRPDIASYTTHPAHAIFPWAERFHPGICRATIKILEKMKKRLYYDSKIIKPIYFNYFVAKSSIYEDYIKTFLKPAIHLMTHDPEIRKLVCVNSHYRAGKMTPELAKQIGFDYYPLHPFICERLINLYLLKHPFKIVTW
jgi:hypothetical protein